MKQNIQALMDITSLAEDNAIIALFSAEKNIPNHKRDAVTNVSGRFRRVFQNDTPKKHGEGHFYKYFDRYTDCINNGDIDNAKTNAYKTLKAFLSGVLMFIALASSVAVTDRDTKVWKARNKHILDAYDKIMGTDIVKHAVSANGATIRGVLINLDAKLLKNILAFIEKALAASEKAEATADDIRAAWSAEQENNTKTDEKSQGLKAYPLVLVLKEMMAKAKEKEASAKAVKPKSSGSKKFKTESTHRSKQEQKQH